MSKINESTESLIDNYVDIVRNSEISNENVYATIEAIYLGQSRPQVIANRIRGGVDAFEQKINELKANKNIEQINIKLFRTTDPLNTRPSQQTGFIDFYEYDYGAQPQSQTQTQPRPQPQPLGNIDFNSKRQDERINNLENRLLLRELELNKEFEIKSLKRDYDFEIKRIEGEKEIEVSKLNNELEYLKSENKDFRAEISRLLNELSDLEHELYLLRGKHIIAVKENQSMESLGMGGFKDLDFAKVGGQIAVTGVTTAVQNILMDTFGLKGFGETNNENQNQTKEDPIEEATY